MLHIKPYQDRNGTWGVAMFEDNDEYTIRKGVEAAVVANKVEEHDNSTQQEDAVAEALEMNPDIGLPPQRRAVPITAAALAHHEAGAGSSTGCSVAAGTPLPLAETWHYLGDRPSSQHHPVPHRQPPSIMGQTQSQWSQSLSAEPEETLPLGIVDPFTTPVRGARPSRSAACRLKKDDDAGSTTTSRTRTTPAEKAEKTLFEGTKTVADAEKEYSLEAMWNDKVAPRIVQNFSFRLSSMANKISDMVEHSKDPLDESNIQKTSTASKLIALSENIVTRSTEFSRLREHPLDLIRALTPAQREFFKTLPSSLVRNMLTSTCASLASRYTSKDDECFPMTLKLAQLTGTEVERFNMNLLVANGVDADCQGWGLMQFQENLVVTAIENVLKLPRNAYKTSFDRIAALPWSGPSKICPESVPGYVFDFADASRQAVDGVIVGDEESFTTCPGFGFFKLSKICIAVLQVVIDILKLPEGTTPDPTMKAVVRGLVAYKGCLNTRIRSLLVRASTGSHNKTAAQTAWAVIETLVQSTMSLDQAVDVMKRTWSELKVLEQASIADYLPLEAAVHVLSGWWESDILVKFKVMMKAYDEITSPDYIADIFPEIQKLAQTILLYVKQALAEHNCYRTYLGITLGTLAVSSGGEIFEQQQNSFHWFEAMVSILNTLDRFLKLDEEGPALPLVLHELAARSTLLLDVVDAKVDFDEGLAKSGKEGETPNIEIVSDAVREALRKMSTFNASLAKVVHSAPTVEMPEDGRGATAGATLFLVVEQLRHYTYERFILTVIRLGLSKANVAQSTLTIVKGLLGVLPASARLVTDQFSFWGHRP